MGAHSKGENAASIGICCEGGLTKITGPNAGIDTRHKDQIKLQIELIDTLMKRFPGAVVEGHRDMPGAATQCPGYSGRSWWDRVLRERASESKVQRPDDIQTPSEPVRSPGSPGGRSAWLNLPAMLTAIFARFWKRK